MRKFRTLAVPVLLAVVLAMTAFLPTAQAQEPAPPTPVKLYVLAGKGEKLPDNLLAEVAAQGGTVRYSLPEIGLAVVESSNPNFASSFAGHLTIESVLPNIQLLYNETEPQELAQSVPNPPASAEDDLFFNLQWGLDAIDAPEAWATGARGQGARVAVLDDGIDSDHPDLAANLNITLSASFVPGETFEYVPLFPGDAFSHGSHMAGIIAAPDNGVGIIGVAPQAEIVAVKVLKADGSGSFDALIAGIVYAANIDADVINMSLGAPVPKDGYCDASGCVTKKEVKELVKLISRATKYAHKKGAVLVAAAGNDATNNKANNAYYLPADAEDVLSISGTGPLRWALNPATNLDVPGYYTNYGKKNIDFAAPGGNLDFELFNAFLADPTNPANYCIVAGKINACGVFDWVYSTGSNGEWYWAQGTSAATAYAAGVAALVVGKHGGQLKAKKVEKALKKGADDLGPKGKDAFFGKGRINALKSVTANIGGGDDDGDDDD